MSEPDDWPLHDLLEAVALGRARGDHLLTAGERAVLDRLGALEGDAGVVYARLVARKPLAFPLDELTVSGVDDPLPAVEALEALGLVDRLVPWALRAELSPARRLKEGARRLGLPRGGRWRELVDRLAPHRHWDPSPWIRPRHRGLVRRLQRWATLRAWPRPEEAVLERMEVRRWPRYALTQGPALHPHRAALLAWEQLHGALTAGTLGVGAALHALEGGHGRAPARLDLTRSLREALVAHARAQEREAPEGALALYTRLAPLAAPGTLAFRHARTLEALGRPEAAFAHLEAARPLAVPSERAALLRAARRLGRALGRGVAPDPPLRAARTRELTLQAAGSDHRPLWRGTPGAGPAPVEAAVVDHLAARGREAHHVEGALFRTLAALLFADAAFLPVPGQLPVVRLDAPLDLGTAAFRRRRAQAIDAVLGAVHQGHAEALLAPALATWGDVRLRGRHDLPEGLLLAVARHAPPEGLAHVLEHLLEGRSRGLPDLVVLPGPSCRVDGHPATVRSPLLLVEIKGPGDTLADAQRRWHDRLLGWGFAVELWEVRGEANDPGR